MQTVVIVERWLGKCLVSGLDQCKSIRPQKVLAYDITKCAGVLYCRTAVLNYCHANKPPIHSAEPVGPDLRYIVRLMRTRPDWAFIS